MKTVQDDCQFVCITQSDYYKILNDGETNQKRIEEDGQIVLVSEFDASIKNGFKVNIIRRDSEQASEASLWRIDKFTKKPIPMRVRTAQCTPTFHKVNIFSLRLAKKIKKFLPFT